MADRDSSSASSTGVSAEPSHAQAFRPEEGAAWPALRRQAVSLASEGMALPSGRPNDPTDTAESSATSYSSDSAARAALSVASSAENVTLAAPNQLMRSSGVAACGMSPSAVFTRSAQLAPSMVST